MIKCLPNWSHPSVPIGDESKFRFVSLHGKKRIFVILIAYFEFRRKDSFDLGKSHDMFDFENAAKITGSKFSLFKNEAAILELALTRWALSIVKSKGFSPMIVPEICNRNVLDCCGFQPRDDSCIVNKNSIAQIYNLNYDRSLIATSEIPLAGIMSNTVIKQSELPIKYCGYSQCYRKEAGQGKDAKGIYRLHQFGKIEMFAFTEESKSEEMLDEMIKIQTEMYEQLDFHFRVIELPTEELGASAYRKYDHEVWLPSKNAFCEV